MSSSRRSRQPDTSGVRLAPLTAFFWRRDWASRRGGIFLYTLTNNINRTSRPHSRLNSAFGSSSSHSIESALCTQLLHYHQLDQDIMPFEVLTRTSRQEDVEEREKSRSPGSHRPKARSPAPPSSKIPLERSPLNAQKFERCSACTGKEKVCQACLTRYIELKALNLSRDTGVDSSALRLGGSDSGILGGSASGRDTTAGMDDWLKTPDTSRPGDLTRSPS